MNKEEYINAINVLISKIDDIWILEQIYRCVINITK